MRSRTSPWPGSGTGDLAQFTVLLPGKIGAPSSCFDRSVQIPKVFPVLVCFPQKYLPFNQPAVPIDAGNGVHIRLAQRFARRGIQIPR